MTADAVVVEGWRGVGLGCVAQMKREHEEGAVRCCRGYGTCEPGQGSVVDVLGRGCPMLRFQVTACSDGGGAATLQQRRGTATQRTRTETRTR